MVLRFKAMIYNLALNRLIDEQRHIVVVTSFYFKQTYGNTVSPLIGNRDIWEDNLIRQDREIWITFTLTGPVWDLESRQICFVHDTIYKFDDQTNYFEAQTLTAVSFDVMSEDCTASGIDQKAEIIHNVDLRL